jgi:hypothetical protein
VYGFTDVVGHLTRQSLGKKGASDFFFFETSTLLAWTPNVDCNAPCRLPCTSHTDTLSVKELSVAQLIIWDLAVFLVVLLIIESFKSFMSS